MPHAPLRPIATMKFVDGGAGDEGVAIVRASTGQVALALSVMTNGDIEVLLTLSTAEELGSAIDRALATARSG